MSTTYNQTIVAGAEQPIGSIEDLRHILEHKHGKPISYGEAEDIGDSLISFFEVLASEA